MKSNEEEIQDPTMDVEHELPLADGAGDSTDGASEIEKLKAENAAYLDRLARLQAEFDNFRKRNVREQQEFRDYALTDTLRQLLPILDRATKVEAPSVADLRAGVELIDRQFHDVLTRLGVEPIATKGQKFDPNLHQAVQAVESDSAEDGEVLEELARGYRLRDRILRAAMVCVAKK
jgi:molecular chaperone GrpE